MCFFSITGLDFEAGQWVKQDPSLVISLAFRNVGFFQVQGLRALVFISRCETLENSSKN